jgi:hypothetical protein
MRRAFIATAFVSVAIFLSVQAASANVFVGHTNLTIHVAGSSVYGKLVGNPQCRPDQTIELFVDGASQGTTSTDGSGNYSFTGSFSTGSTVYTFFGGSQTGQHPNRFVCTPAVSRVVAIKGQGNGNSGGDHENHNGNDDEHGNHNGNGDDEAARMIGLARLVASVGAPE